VLRGGAFNNLTLDLTPESIAGGSYDLIGMDFAPVSGTSLDVSPDPADVDAPFNSFDGALYEGNTLMAVVTAVSFTLNNNRTLQPVIFSSGSPDVFEGTAAYSGSLTALFENPTMLNKFINETQSTIDIRMNNPNGIDFMRMRAPIVYTGGTMDPPAQGPVPLVMPFDCIPDDTTMLTNFLIQRSNI
jgi:hypothetical protein